MDIRKKFFTEKVEKLWNQVVASASLEVFRKQVDKALVYMAYKISGEHGGALLMV